MSEMVKYIEKNGETNQINQRMAKHIEEKVQMFKKPENPKKVQEFEKINTSNKKKKFSQHKIKTCFAF